MRTGIVVMFALYTAAMLVVGMVFYRRTGTLDDYLLGGRTLNRWVTALSAQASDMSGWLLMGLPGAVYLHGLGETWMALGLLAGIYLNWRLVAPRLRVETQRVGAITLPAYFERRFGRAPGAVGLVSAVVVFFFFTVYSASGLVASGLLFQSVLGVDYGMAVWLGAAVILAYTVLGGFMAVCWTDVIQGTLILLALLVVPVVAGIEAGGPGAVVEALHARGTAGSLVPKGGVIAMVSAASWGLGYFGQPHILVRFMAARRSRDIAAARRIATGWSVLTLGGAVAVGLVGIAYYPGGLEHHERVFIELVDSLFDPWIAGVLLAAILAAIMSTIDSQLLVSSSAVTEDLYARWIRRGATQGELVWIGRASVAAITLVAVYIAMDRNSTVLGLVRYAWGGLGAAFGPAVLFSLFWPGTTYAGVLAGMVTGAVVMVAWNASGLGAIMYEIVPGFLAGSMALVLVSSARGRRRGPGQGRATPGPATPSGTARET